MPLNRKSIRAAHVRQQDSSDCGAACLLSLIRYYGGDSTIRHLREISGTSQQGTTLLGLYQAANQIGFTADGAEANGVQDLIEHGKPTILAVRLEEKYEHYIVCFGFEQGYFIIGDPAKGIENYTPEELEKIWTKKMPAVGTERTIRAKNRNQTAKGTLVARTYSQRCGAFACKCHHRHRDVRLGDGDGCFLAKARR